MTINPRDLDNYITGHYGEDYFTVEEPEECDLCGKEFNAARPAYEMFDPKEDIFDATTHFVHLDCGSKKGFEVVE